MRKPGRHRSTASGPADVRASRSEVRAGEPAQAQPRQRYRTSEAADAGSGSCRSTGSIGGHLSRGSSNGAGKAWPRDYQPRPQGRAPDPEPRGHGVDGRVRADLAGGAPKIKLLPDTDKRQPYPLNWDEQAGCFRELPAHLAEMALFAVNTGCRDGEICRLQWDWEVDVPELETSVFIVPGRFVKNGDERLVVLNRIAAAVVEAQRGSTRRTCSPTRASRSRGC